MILLCCCLPLAGSLTLAEELTMFHRPIFNTAPTIEMIDPLAVALGALNRGVPLVYTYGDVVKLAGHSCPAMAGGFKLIQIALGELYPDTVPTRGDIKVRVLGGREDNVNGPISQVVTLITGASPETGFGGLGGGKFNRKDLLAFDEDHPSPPDCIFSAVFERGDTGRKIHVTYYNHMLASKPEMGALMPKAVSGKATDGELDRFGELWHERIEIILLDPPEGMFVITAE
jgi:hypothetical protein